MYTSSQYQAAPASFDTPSCRSTLYSRLESMAQAKYEQQPSSAYSIQSFPSLQTDGPLMTSLPFSSPTALAYSSAEVRSGYNANSSSSYSLFTPSHTEYHFQPQDFLKPGKEGKFIGKAEEIKEYVVDAFEKIFQAPFPSNIVVSICNEKEFRKIASHPGTIGLSINRGRAGLISEIFVLNDSLARVMLTLGHELGHVLTATLPSPHDEEAKAYAFSLVWMKAIKEHDIAGLSDAIVTERPAENGLHNVAFGFVERMLKKGMELWELYGELVQRTVSVAGL